LPPLRKPYQQGKTDCKRTALGRAFRSRGDFPSAALAMRNGRISVVLQDLRAMLHVRITMEGKE
jgi:hypothetical protein